MQRILTNRLTDPRLRTTGCPKQILAASSAPEVLQVWADCGQNAQVKQVKRPETRERIP